MTAPGTILEEAGSVVWDVIILGAGPAGALTAYRLATRGARTLLVDRRPFPRSKVCGSCLNLVALGALNAAGLGHVVSELGGITLKGLRVSFRSYSTQLPLPGGAVVSRTRLDAALVDAAVRSGTVFLPQTRGVVGRLNSVTRSVDLMQPHRKVTAWGRVVLIATGLGETCSDGDPEIRSHPAPSSRIGAGCILDEVPDFYQEGIVYMAVAQAGYVGLVRMENGCLNVAAAFDRSYVKSCGGPGEAVERTLTGSGFALAPALRDADWQGTPLLTRRTRPIAGERFFLVGDATGYVEPFTGEGMAWAMMSGLALAPLIEKAIHGWNPELPRAWVSAHRRLVSNRQFLCRGIAALIRQPRLARAALGLAARVPRVAQLMIRLVNTPPGLPQTR